MKRFLGLSLGLIIILVIISETFALEMQEVGSLRTVENLSLFVYGDYVYLAGYKNGLRIVDVSNPSSPVLVDTFPMGTYVVDVFVSGNYAYVLDSDLSIKVLDISQPTMPVLIGDFESQTSIADIWVRGRYLFCAGPFFKVLDISNPSAPREISSIDIGDSGGDIFVDGNYAYIAGPRFHIIDISDVTKPVMLSTIDLENFGSVFVSGSYAYLTDENRGFKIFDISNPTRPRMVSRIDLGISQDVALYKNFAFVAAASDGLFIVDVSNPFNPQIINRLENEYFRKVFIKDNYIYALTGYGLRIWKLIEKRLPPEVEIKVNGEKGLNKAVVLNRSDKLNISISLNPQDYEEGDYFIAVVVPGGSIFWYSAYNNSWIASNSPIVAYQGKLLEFSDVPVISNINCSVLPYGKYTVYFGVDTIKNGKLDLNALFVDECQFEILSSFYHN